MTKTSNKGNNSTNNVNNIIYGSKGNNSLNYKQAVLFKIKPSKEEQEKNKTIVDEVLSKIEASLKKNKVLAQIKPGGSFAKNTWLSGDFDCDVFIRFDKEKFSHLADCDKKISDLTEKNLPFEEVMRIHGSRDYFQFEYKKINFEIVPTILEKNPRDAKNSTDISPMHIDWVQKKEKEIPDLSDEIRITKQFFKAQGIYGAESYIFGFSGHVIDILVANYGSFENLLKAASKLKEKEVIDPEKVYKNSKEALNILNQAKIASALIVIDPILPTRNASAALGKDKFEKLILSAKTFLDTKNTDEKIKMFEKPIFDPAKIKSKKNEKTIMIKIEQKKGSKDIVGCKILKLFEHIKKQLAINEFTLIDGGWSFLYRKDSYIYFIVKDEVLSDTMIRIGPPVSLKEPCENFRKVNKKVFEKNKRLYAEVKRPYTIADRLIKYFLSDDYAKDRIDGYKII